MRQMMPLFEDVAISPGVLLAINFDRGVPGPHVLNELAVLLLGGVELLEVVALPVRGNVERSSVILTTDHVDTTDKAVVVGTVDRLGTEDILAGSLKTGLETTDQVVGHEGKLELIVVPEVNTPQRVFFSVEVLPEPRQDGRASVFVGVETLEVLEVNASSGRKQRQRVLRLLSRLLSGLLGSRLGLLLLLGRGVLDDLLSKDGVGDDSLESGLVDDSVVPSGDGGVLGAPFLVQNSGESTSKEGSSEVIGQGDTLANKVGVGSEVRLEDSDVLQGSLGSFVDILLVVAVQAHERTVPATEARQNLSVDKGQPTEDGSIVLLGLTQEGGLFVLGSHYRITVSLKIHQANNA